MPPPTAHQGNQYYINSNKANVSRSDDVFDAPVTDQNNEEVPPPPPPKMKHSPSPCQPPCRPPPLQPERDSVQSGISEDSRISTDSSVSADSRFTIISETSIESVTSLESRQSTASQSSTDSSDDTTVADYVDMAATSSYRDVNIVQRNDSKTKQKPPPKVHPKPSRLSGPDSRDEQVQGAIPTFDDELDSGSSSSEYMPMNSVPKQLKQSHSESAVNKHFARRQSDDEYMSPTDVCKSIFINLSEINQACYILTVHVLHSSYRSLLSVYN